MIFYSSVTQPSEAEATFLMYLNSVPLVAAGGGGTQSCRRFSISVCANKTNATCGGAPSIPKSDSLVHSPHQTGPGRTGKDKKKNKIMLYFRDLPISGWFNSTRNSFLRLLLWQCGKVAKMWDEDGIALQ